MLNLLKSNIIWWCSIISHCCVKCLMMAIQFLMYLWGQSHNEGSDPQCLSILPSTKLECWCIIISPVPPGLPVMVFMKHTLKYLDHSSCLAKCLHTNLCTFTFTLPPLLFTQEFRWYCLFLAFCLTTVNLVQNFNSVSGRRHTVVHMMMIVMTEDCESFSIVK